jgi:hypothetical protein
MKRHERIYFHKLCEVEEKKIRFDFFSIGEKEETCRTHTKEGEHITRQGEMHPRQCTIDPQ